VARNLLAGYAFIVLRQTSHEEVVAAVTTQASFKVLVYIVTSPASAEIVGVKGRQTTHPV
jgi:hypothetical protein